MKFHSETWPTLKEKYVDTGKVRFIMREFPLDPLATAGFMLARCAGDERWYPVLDLLYKTKESWGEPHWVCRRAGCLSPTRPF
jgi:protein-disulfide isomerase